MKQHKERPAHVIAHGGEDHTMCGIRLRESTALPYLCAAHVPAHQRGRGVVLCPACEDAYRWLLQEVGHG